MTKQYYTEQYKGYTINIHQDSDPRPPRDWDSLGTMYYRHRSYILGDVEIPEAFYNDNSEYIYIDSYDSFVEWRKSEGDDIAVILPLYIYDHGGVTMNTSGFSCGWDSGQVGWIVATKQDIRENWQVKRVTKKLIEQAEKQLVNEVKTFDDYLTGNVWGFEVLDSGGKQIEILWGFLGDYEQYCLTEARGMVDYQVEQDRLKQQKRVKQYIKSNVPLDYRIA